MFIARSSAVFLIVLVFVASVAADEIVTPAGPGAGQPFLTTSGGDLLMSWIEPASKGHALKFARFQGGQWSAAQTVVEGPEIDANWANFPSVSAGTDGMLFAHWLQKNSGGMHAVDVYLATSRDGGKSWSKPILLNRDNTPTEHGFASMVASSDGSLDVIWLDGRAMKGHDGEMALRHARFKDGDFSGESVVDWRVCECCGTSLASTKDGLVAVYRDRSSTEDRDTSVVTRRRGGQWSKPRLVHRDGWNIKGCPVNGPQIAARGNHVATAWFTAPANQPRVNVALSNDGGATFAAPIRVDAGAPAGRVDVRVLDDGSALVTWIDGVGDAASVMLRRVSPNGKLGPSVKVGSSGAARTTGFPRTAIVGERLYVAWTEPTAKRIRLTSLPLP